MTVPELYKALFELPDYTVISDDLRAEYSALPGETQITLMGALEQDCPTLAATLASPPPPPSLVPPVSIPEDVVLDEPDEPEPVSENSRTVTRTDDNTVTKFPKTRGKSPKTVAAEKPKPTKPKRGK